jgi:hypothetical protein
MVQNFIELDFPTVTAKKCYQIKRNKVLLEKINIEGENFSKQHFCLMLCIQQKS